MCFSMNLSKNVIVLLTIWIDCVLFAWVPFVWTNCNYNIYLFVNWKFQCGTHCLTFIISSWNKEQERKREKHVYSNTTRLYCYFVRMCLILCMLKKCICITFYIIVYTHLYVCTSFEHFMIIANKLKHSSVLCNLTSLHDMTLPMIMTMA